MRQLLPAVAFRGRIPIVMLNPGSFTDGKSFARDTTLRHVRKAFLNSGFEIEILNLFNIAEPKKKKLAKLGRNRRNNKNPILKRLGKYGKGSKVLIQWGKLDEDVFAHANDVLDFVEKKKLEIVGMKNDNDIYVHPRAWNFGNFFGRFRKEILPRLY